VLGVDYSAAALSPEECRRRLAGNSVGRVAATDRALPMIVPVSYTVTSAEIHLRTRPGGILANACNGSVVAFQTDALAPGRPEWSVLVVGIARLRLNACATGSPVRGPGAATLGWDQHVTITISQISGWTWRPVAAFL
jgi:hypothetical protein